MSAVRRAGFPKRRIACIEGCHETAAAGASFAPRHTELGNSGPRMSCERHRAIIGSRRSVHRTSEDEITEVETKPRSDGRSAHANRHSTRTPVARDTGEPEHPVIAIYTPVFLTIPLTFIYRQVLGARPKFQPLVLTNERRHEEAFPLKEPIFLQEPLTAPQRLYCKLVRFATGRYMMLPPGHVAHWKPFVEQANASLIHAHFGPPGIEMLPVAEATALPLLVSFHGYDASKLFCITRDTCRTYRSSHALTSSFLPSS